MNENTIDGGIINPITVEAKRDNVYVNTFKPFSRKPVVWQDDWTADKEGLSIDQAKNNVLEYYLNVWAPIYVKSSGRSVQDVRKDISKYWHDTHMYVDAITTPLSNAAGYNLGGSRFIGVNSKHIRPDVLAHEFSHRIGNGLKISKKEKKQLLDAYRTDLTIPKTYGWRAILFNNTLRGMEEARALNNEHRYSLYEQYKKSNYNGSFDEYIDSIPAWEIEPNDAYYASPPTSCRGAVQKNIRKYDKTTYRGISYIDREYDDGLLTKSLKEHIEDFIRENKLNTRIRRDRQMLRDYIKDLKRRAGMNMLFNDRDKDDENRRHALKYIAQNDKNPYKERKTWV